MSPSPSLVRLVLGLAGFWALVACSIVHAALDEVVVTRHGGRAEEQASKVTCESPGEICEVRGAATTTLRDYSKEAEDSRVRKHYADMRKFQTEDFVRRMELKFGSFENGKMTLREAFKLLESYVDASDPDVTLPNVVHNFMAAESARRAGKPDWMQLTALLHDLGKIMFVFGDEKDGMSGKASGPQFSLGGDTWVLGTPIPGTAVYPEYNSLNADHVKLNGTDTNRPGTGLRNLRFPWGHDEYVYRFLAHPKNGCKLPEVALLIARLHSCYPLHTKRSYDHLLAPGDIEILDEVIEFNKFDLYSKADSTIEDMAEVWPYYESLMDKYFERGSKGILYF